MFIFCWDKFLTNWAKICSVNWQLLFEVLQKFLYFRQNEFPTTKWSMTIAFQLFVFALFFSNTVSNIYEKELQEDIIRGYNRLVRPVQHNSDILVVRFGVRLVSLLDVVSWIKIYKILIIIESNFWVLFKDEKNQILTTNVWLKHVTNQMIQYFKLFYLIKLSYEKN